MKARYKQQRALRLKIKDTFRILVFSSVALVIVFAIFFIYGNFGTPNRAQAGAGMLGAKTVTTTNVIVNEFTTLTANASSGTSSITVASSAINSNSRFSGNLAAGELVMIVQMQGTTMTTSSTTSSAWGAVSAYNNAGLFEFDEVSSVPDGTHISLVSALKNSYAISGKVQVIRVPRYSTLTVNSGASITTSAWNGSTGGIVAIEVSGTTTINGTIDVSGMGFAGGVLTQYSVFQSYYGSNSSTYASTDSSSGGAQKGEGIGGGVTTYDGLGGRYGRGAPANGGGGGNNHNGGGGGGSNGNNGGTYNGFGNPDTINYSIAAWDLDGAISTFHKNTSSGGGRGGYSYSVPKNATDPTVTAPGNSAWKGDYRSNVGGLGGRPLSNSGNRIFMGGGGGAGDSNDGYGSAGASGGGIVYLIAGGTVSGSGTINANGADAASSLGKDAAGGGGGGGSVIVYTGSATLSGLTVNAKGGQGGTQNWGSGSKESEGPGGGGGGGYASITNPNTFTVSTSGGVNGTTTQVSTFAANGATMGVIGLTSPNPSNPNSNGSALPITLVRFSGQKENNAMELDWSTGSEINNDFFTIDKSDNGYDYIQLAKIKGAGTSTHEINYMYTDDNPFKTDNYYRLSQTDFDGKSKTFDPIHVRMNSLIAGSALISAYPVPFRDELKIDYSIQDHGTVEFTIINSGGQVMLSKRAEAGTGLNSFTVGDVASLPVGVYYIIMKHGDDAAKAIKVLKI